MAAPISSHQPARRRLLSALSTLGLTAPLATVGGRGAYGATRRLDLEQPWDNLEGYLKARSDISGEKSVTWRTGTVRSFIPGRKSRLLMRVHNLKCTRCYKDATGFEFLERECLIFSDLATGEPLTEWYNPFTERTVKDKQKFYYQHFREHIDAQRARG